MSMVVQLGPNFVVKTVISTAIKDSERFYKVLAEVWLREDSLRSATGLIKAFWEEHDKHSQSREIQEHCYNKPAHYEDLVKGDLKRKQGDETRPEGLQKKPKSDAAATPGLPSQPILLDRLSEDVTRSLRAIGVGSSSAIINGENCTSPVASDSAHVLTLTLLEDKLSKGDAGPTDSPDNVASKKVKVQFVVGPVVKAGRPMLRAFSPAAGSASKTRRPLPASRNARSRSTADASPTRSPRQVAVVPSPKCASSSSHGSATSASLMLQTSNSVGISSALLVIPTASSSSLLRLGASNVYVTKISSPETISRQPTVRVNTDCLPSLISPKSSTQSGSLRFKLLPKFSSPSESNIGSQQTAASLVRHCFQDSRLALHGLRASLPRQGGSEGVTSSAKGNLSSSSSLGQYQSLSYAQKQPLGSSIASPRGLSPGGIQRPSVSGGSSQAPVSPCVIVRQVTDRPARMLASKAGVESSGRCSREGQKIVRASLLSPGACQSLDFSKIAIEPPVTSSVAKSADIVDNALCSVRAPLETPCTANAQSPLMRSVDAVHQSAAQSAVSSHLLDCGSVKEVSQKTDRASARNCNSSSDLVTGAQQPLMKPSMLQHPRFRMQKMLCSDANSEYLDASSVSDAQTHVASMGMASVQTPTKSLGSESAKSPKRIPLARTLLHPRTSLDNFLHTSSVASIRNTSAALATTSGVVANQLIHPSLRAKLNQSRQDATVMAGTPLKLLANVPVQLVSAADTTTCHLDLASLQTASNASDPGAIDGGSTRHSKSQLVEESGNAKELYSKIVANKLIHPSLRAKMAQPRQNTTIAITESAFQSPAMVPLQLSSVADTSTPALNQASLQTAGMVCTPRAVDGDSIRCGEYQSVDKSGNAKELGSNIIAKPPIHPSLRAKMTRPHQDATVVVGATFLSPAMVPLQLSSAADTSTPELNQASLQTASITCAPGAVDGDSMRCGKSQLLEESGNAKELSSKILAKPPIHPSLRAKLTRPHQETNVVAGVAFQAKAMVPLQLSSAADTSTPELNQASLRTASISCAPGAVDGDSMRCGKPQLLEESGNAKELSSRVLANQPIHPSLRAKMTRPPQDTTFVAGAAFESPTMVPLQLSSAADTSTRQLTSACDASTCQLDCASLQAADTASASGSKGNDSMRHNESRAAVGSEIFKGMSSNIVCANIDDSPIPYLAKGADTTSVVTEECEVALTIQAVAVLDLLRSHPQTEMQSVLPALLKVSTSSVESHDGHKDNSECLGSSLLENYPVSCLVCRLTFENAELLNAHALLAHSGKERTDVVGIRDSNSDSADTLVSGPSKNAVIEDSTIENSTSGQVENEDIASKMETRRKQGRSHHNCSQCGEAFSSFAKLKSHDCLAPDTVAPCESNDSASTIGVQFDEVVVNGKPSFVCSPDDGQEPGPSGVKAKRGLAKLRVVVGDEGDDDTDNDCDHDVNSSRDSIKKTRRSSADAKRARVHLTCEQCGAVFHRAGSLNQHIISAHMSSCDDEADDDVEDFVVSGKVTRSGSVFHKATRSGAVSRKATRSSAVSRKATLSGAVSRKATLSGAVSRKATLSAAVCTPVGEARSSSNASGTRTVCADSVGADDGPLSVDDARQLDLVEDALRCRLRVRVERVSATLIAALLQVSSSKGDD